MDRNSISFMAQPNLAPGPRMFAWAAGVLIASGLVLGVFTWRHQSDLQQRAEQSLGSDLAARAQLISERVRIQLRATRALATRYQETIADLSTAPDAATPRNLLASRLGELVPAAFAFALADIRGNPLFEEVPGLIDEGVRRDIQRFTELGKGDVVTVPREPAGSHYLIMTPWDSIRGQVGVLILGFRTPGVLAGAGAQDGSPRQPLLVLSAENGWRVLAGGDGDAIKNGTVLAEAEQDRLAPFVPVRDTPWAMTAILSDGWQVPPLARVLWPVSGGLLLLGLSSAWAGLRTRRNWRDRFVTESSLRTSERRLKAILDNSGVVVYVKDPEGNYLLVNREYETRLGLAPEQVLGRTDLEFLPRDDAEAFRSNDLTVLNHKAPIRFEETLSRDGDDTTYLSVKFPLYDEDGQLEAIGGIATDITDRKRAERALQESEERYHAIFDQAADLILLLDAGTLAVVEFNDAACAGLGYSRVEFSTLKLSDIEIMHDPSGDGIRHTREIALHGEERYEAVFRTSADEPRDMQVSARALDLSGRRFIVVFARDVTEFKRTEESLRKLSSAVKHSGSLVVITDADDRIEYVNPRFTEITGYSAHEALGQPWHLLTAAEAPSAASDALTRAVRDGEEWRGELRHRRKSGDPYWALISVTPVEDEHGHVTHYVTVGEDVTALKDSQFQMEQLAFYDTLTGLPNRQLFREQLEQAVKMVERTGREIAVLYLDLDHFKRVNDTLGHDAGDILLQRMGERLSRCVRREDTVARLSGDEFTVLLAEVEGPGGASRVAHKILHALADPIRIAGQEVFVSASIGLTLCPRDGVDASALMKNADLAMYQAKERGRDNYQFYTRELNEQASERLHKESALRRALIEGHMVLHYQPLVEQASGEICSVEALLRWTPPQAEMVMPDQFIGVAEETGLIVPIGRWVLETACRQIQALHDQGASELSVAVNLSTRQFHDPDLVSTVEMALAQTGLAPAWLQLEITESMLMERVEQAIETLWRLKNLGVSLSIDDFGVGYSSLSYLKRLPVDTIKVDRDFVRDIPRDTNDTEITAAVIAMAHKLKLSVVAEGVETEAQVQFLRNNQCDYLQGFLFGAPQPLDLLRERLVAGGRMPSPPTPLPLSAVSRPT